MGHEVRRVSREHLVSRGILARLDRPVRMVNQVYLAIAAQQVIKVIAA